VKANPWPIIKAHRATYVHAHTGLRRWQDHLQFDGVPLGVIATCAIIEVKLPSAASVGLLTVAGLLSAFLFGVMLQVAQRALDWADQEPKYGPETTAQALFLEEIAANAGYAALISIATATAFVVASIADRAALIAATAIGLGLAVHLAMVLVMVMNRVFALTRARLNRARTAGATVTELPTRSSTG
jgi:hypothetical protein